MIHQDALSAWTRCVSTNLPHLSPQSPACRNEFGEGRSRDRVAG